MAFFLKNLLLKVVPIFPSLKVITPLKSMVVLIAPINHLLLLKLGKPKVSMILLPIFKKEVDELNKNNKNKNSLKISDHSPELYLGYFPFISMMNKMDIKKYVDYFNLHNSFEFDLYELLSSLIYARLVNPCSKHRTFHEVLPQLRDGVHFSYDQLLDGLEFIGNDYGKFIEIFNEQTKKFYDINTSKTYFDCSNFYFEIDREDDFRRKGPSKRKQKRSHCRLRTAS